MIRPSSLRHENTLRLMGLYLKSNSSIFVLQLVSAQALGEAPFYMDSIAIHQVEQPDFTFPNMHNNFCYNRYIKIRMNNITAAI